MVSIHAAELVYMVTIIRFRGVSWYNLIYSILLQRGSFWMGHIYRTKGSLPFLHPKRMSLLRRALLILIIVIKCLNKGIFTDTNSKGTTTPHLLKKHWGGHTNNSTYWALWMFEMTPNEVLKWWSWWLLWSKRTWSMTLRMWWHVKHCINRARSMVEKVQQAFSGSVKSSIWKQAVVLF